MREGRQVGAAGSLASIVFLLAVIAVAWWQFGGVADDGMQIQVLNPDLAIAWRAAIIAVLVVEILILILLWRVGLWTPALAVANVLANVVAAGVTVVPLVLGDLLVDDLPEQLGRVFDDPVDWSVPTEPIAALIIVLAIWDGLHSMLAARAGSPVAQQS